MKELVENKLAISLLFFGTLCTNVLGQSRSYPFDIHKTGQGEKAIFFIPGLACSGEVWNETRAKFEKDYTCYTLTMAGFAGIEAHDSSNFTFWVTSIADFIKENHIVKPILVGHSMGGGLAMAIAADYPELIGRIVVVDALPCLSALFDPSFISQENNDCSEVVNQMSALSDEQFYQIQKSAIPGLLEDTTMLETVVGWGVKSDRKTFAEMYCDFSNTDLREKIRSIKCPTLILLEYQFVAINAAIEAQYRNVKKARLEYSTKGLHFIMFDDKEWFFNQLTGFIPVK